MQKVKESEGVSLTELQKDDEFLRLVGKQKQALDYLGKNKSFVFKFLNLYFSSLWGF